MERLAGRYDLREEVARGRGRTLWRGHDTVLDRPVGVLLLDAGHPHAEEVRRAAQLAASVEHAGMLRVIDTAEDQGRVFVVTRWLAGTPLSEQLAVGPLTPDEARYVVRSVADALAEAAKEGVHHLVLDPNDVLLTDHGVVVVGIGVRAALEGVQPEADAESVDAWRLGALLYATLTAKWPGFACAGLPGAPVVGHRVARPRQVRAGVPDDLDEIAWRALDPDHEDPLVTPRAIRDALAAPPVASRPAAPEPVTGAVWRWLGLILVLTLFSTGAVLVAWQIWQNSERPEPQPAGAPTPLPTASPSDSPPSGPLRVQRATVFDPLGDGTENDEDTDLAIDGDPTTAWTTVTYASRSLGGLKEGVGLQLDLGAEKSLGGIELRLVGRGSDVQVWAARPSTDPKGSPPKKPDPDDPLEGYMRLARVRGASDLATWRFSPAVTTDRVVIWLKALPPSTDGYQGGVVEATLFP
ncbi:MAG TPA: protein kinase family protein [Actinomycetes bacterium]|nr:protein kinase family protein [Actinomycetes bacterium]